MGASESTPATDVREEGPAKPAAYAELISSMSPRAALKAADLSAAQLEELSRRFKALDSDNDGVLVPEEFVKHFGSNVLGRSLFKAFDFDGDGRISIPEFIGALGVLSRGDLRTKLGFAFRMFDHDQDKFVAKTEMQAMLGSVIDTLALVDPRKRKVRPDIIEISNRLFAKLDRNRDGLIDKNEFCEGLASDHEAQALLGMGSNRRSDARFNQRKGHSKELPVSWGQKEWALVVSMMIGMRAAGEAAHERWDSLPKPFKPSPESFTYVNEFEIPSNELVQAGSAYKFEDYAPEVFRALRGMDGVEEDAYLESIGPAQLFARLLLGDLASLTAQVSAGKSGSLFFHTPDGRYMAKTIPMREFKPLLKLLPALYGHIEKHGRETMLMRIYGLHKINGIPFVVVANVLDTPNELQRLYDLKGSTHERLAAEDAFIHKDLNVKKPFDVGAAAEKLLVMLERDSALLAAFDLMDYSLLVGVHKVREGTVLTPGTIVSSDRSTAYYIGLIDYLTEWSFAKDLENFFKGFVADEGTISAVPPKQYQARFIKFMRHILRNGPSL